MFLVYLAALCSALSFLSGIVAVGSGHHFQYTKMDILRGRRDALLYIWVMFSSMFALAHFASILGYGIEFQWGYRFPDTGRWMALHASLGLLLTTAHLFIRSDLSKGRASIEYLWGSRSVVAV